MINCEWIRKQKKERPSLGSSPGPKCKPNVRLRVRCANTQQPCFSALCDAWLLRKRDEIRESSYIKYRAILERHIKPRLGSRRLGGICTASVDAFTRELLETDGLSVKTVHDILSVLHSVLKDTEARRPTDALALQIRYPKGKRREMRVLTIEEQKRLVAYLLHPTDSCKFGLLLALYTGLRIGELCALRWSCIDLREQTIRIAATMQRLGGTGEGTRIVIGAPKSDSSLRTIPLPAQIAALCRHMQPTDPEAYVLTGGVAYMEPRTLQYRLKRYNRQLYALVFYLSVAVSAVITLLARPAVSLLYGEAYLPAVRPMQVITWYTAFSYLGVARGAWVVCEGKQKYLTPLYIGSALVNVALNFLLIPCWGATGAAVASLLTQISTTFVFPLLLRPLRPNGLLMCQAVLLRDVFPKRKKTDNSQRKAC